MTCALCKMPTGAPAEYHPYAACLMFKACHNSETVFANLTAAVEYGMKAQRQGLDLDEVMHDIRKIVHETVPDTDT